MDKESRRIDKEYQEILEAEKRAKSLETNARIVQELGIDVTELLANAIAEREQVNKLRLKQAQDFFLLDDSRMIDVLRMRYVEDKAWADIADALNYSERRVKGLRDMALAEIYRKRPTG